MSVNRVLLVSAPLDNETERREAVNSRCFPPLGLLKIATHFQATLPHIEIKVVDGDLVGLADVRRIIDSFQPDVVGVSVLTPSYQAAISIARHSKAEGVRYVVFGNDHASFFPELILRRHPEVSFVISGDDGDRDFVEFAAAIEKGLNPFESVCNLHGMVAGKYLSTSGFLTQVTNKSATTNWVNPKFLDSSLPHYRQAYASKFGKFHRTSVNPFLVNNAKGCYKTNDRCFYCSINDLQIQTNSTQYFWNLIEKYWKECGFNFFFEVCDNFTGLRAYRRQLVDTIPKWFANSELELMVYGDASMICRDPQLLEDFERLHVRRVNMGIDSGDSRMLRRLKGFSNAQVNYEAIELLSKKAIQIHGSFVLGGPGENERSLGNTLRLIDEAIAEPLFVAVEVSPLFPLPRAPVWDLFLGNFTMPKAQSEFEEIAEELKRPAREFQSVWKQTRAHFIENDAIDLSLVSQLWADHFTLIGYSSLQALVTELNKQITKTGKVTGGFG